MQEEAPSTSSNGNAQYTTGLRAQPLSRTMEVVSFGIGSRGATRKPAGRYGHPKHQRRKPAARTANSQRALEWMSRSGSDRDHESWSLRRCGASHCIWVTIAIQAKARAVH